MLLEDEIEIGQVVYKIFGKIGEGASGTVYSVQCPQKNKYALKVVHNYGRDPRTKYLIDSEIAAQSRFVEEPFIIRIYGHVQRYFNPRQKQKKMYILFELGEYSLRNRIEMDTHIELKQFLGICLDTCRGVYSIHEKGLIHRDIKPENIICVEKRYKVTDFGSHQGGTVGDDFMGTILYMPPELLDQKSYSRRLDVWSLGVSLFETYFKVHPFFYLDYDLNQIDPSLVDKHLRANLAYLMPNFSFQKFMILINSHATRDRVKKVSQIMQVTPPELLIKFCQFFKLKDQRQSIDYFVGGITSIVDLVKQRKRKQIKLFVKKQDLPFDFKLYTDTIEIFYELTSRYGLSMFSQVELQLQLCIYFWSHLKYSKSQIIEFYQEEQIKKNLKSRNELWGSIKSVLFKYWCELNSNKDLQFFSYLRHLRLRILLCGAYYDMKERDPLAEQKFIKIVQSIINTEVNSLEEVLMFYNTLEIRQMEDIEDYLTTNFYTK